VAALIAIDLAAAYALRPKEGVAPPGQVLSNFEDRSQADIVRDCGYSQPLPADPSSSLWLFCDTDVYRSSPQGKWQLSRIISGSTAAVGPAEPGTVPVDLSELATPGSGVRVIPNDDGPAQFLPAPSGLTTADGLACDLAHKAYPASWLTGVTSDPADDGEVLISFNNYCVPIGGGSPLAEGFGLAEYDPAANVRTGEVTVFSSAAVGTLAPQELLGSPIFSGPYLYLFASHCARIDDATCTAGSGSSVYLARVRAKPAAWDRPSSYQWLAGPSIWTGAYSSAVSVIARAAPLAVNVNSFAATGHGFVLIEQTNDVGRFVVYEAASPAGRWRQVSSGTVPCTARRDSLCRAIIGHPDLSTSSELLVSYFNPGAGPYYDPSEGAEGHVMVAALHW
jgi:hypothetical protein